MLEKGLSESAFYSFKRRCYGGNDKGINKIKENSEIDLKGYFYIKF